MTRLEPRTIRPRFTDTCFDTHAHFIPSTFVKSLHAGNAFDGATLNTSSEMPMVLHRQGNSYPLRPQMYDMGSRLAAMNGHGIDMAAVSLAPPLLFYWVEAGAATTWAQQVNDDLRAWVGESGGRMVGVATLPFQSPAAAIAEIHRVAGTPEIVGFQTSPMVLERALDDPEFLPVLEALDEAEIPLLLHPYFVGAAPRVGLDRYHLANTIGHPYQTSVGVARLILSGLLDRLVRIRFMLTHGGGFLPYQIGRLDHAWSARSDAGVCRNPPSSYLNRFWFDSLTHSKPALEFLVAAVGEDRVCYGTDMPADMGGGSLEHQLTDVELDESTARLIAGRNALEFWRVSAPAKAVPHGSATGGQHGL